MVDYNRVKRPKYPISIEFQDEDYIYISSQYKYNDLKKDIEGIKSPIVIHFIASHPL